MPGRHRQPTFGIESNERSALKHSFKTPEKHISPPNCTSSHFIRKGLPVMSFETNFFNEINDLGVSEKRI
ncbi:MAG: hypothetical protein JWP47_3125 [Polaromonas sp.]|nr:hypothetical protein [Polaromonas sp.]